jgi:hypothetical protein
MAYGELAALLIAGAEATNGSEARAMQVRETLRKSAFGP